MKFPPYLTSDVTFTNFREVSHYNAFPLQTLFSAITLLIPNFLTSPCAAPPAPSYDVSVCTRDVTAAFSAPTSG